MIETATRNFAAEVEMEEAMVSLLAAALIRGAAENCAGISIYRLAA